MHSAQKDPYAILSVCAKLGTLQIHNPNESVPRLSQTNCRLRTSASLAVSPTSTTIIAASENPSSSATSLATFTTSRAGGGPAHKTAAPEPHISSLSLSSDGAYLAAGGESGRCYLWSASTGDLFAKWDAHFQRITRLAFTDDDELLLTAGADATVNAYSLAELLDVTREEANPPGPKAVLRAHTLPVTAMSVGFAGASARVLTASADRTARLWHLASATCIATILLPCAATDAALSLDESVVYVGLQNGRVIMADVASLPSTTPISYKSLPALQPPHAPAAAIPSVTSLALSPLCTELIVGYSDGIVRTYDTSSRQLLSSYGKHSTTAAITCVRTIHPIPASLRDLTASTGEVTAVDQASPKLSGMSVTARRAPPPMPVDVSFGKTHNPDLATTFAPLITLPGTGTVQEAAWCAIDSVVKTVLQPTSAVDGAYAAGSTREVRSSVAKRGEVDGADVEMHAGGEHEDAVPAEILKELEFLRRRNRQLEEAGRHLIDFVENKNG